MQGNIRGVAEAHLHTCTRHGREPVLYAHLCGGRPHTKKGGKDRHNYWHGMQCRLQFRRNNAMAWHGRKLFRQTEACSSALGAKVVGAQGADPAAFCSLFCSCRSGGFRLVSSSGFSFLRASIGHVPSSQRIRQQTRLNTSRGQPLTLTPHMPDPNTPRANVCVQQQTVHRSCCLLAAACGKYDSA